MPTKRSKNTPAQKKLTFKDIELQTANPMNGTVFERSIHYVYAMLENTQSEGGITYKEVFFRTDLMRTLKDAEAKQSTPDGVTVEISPDAHSKLVKLLEETTWNRASAGVEACCRAILEPSS